MAVSHLCTECQARPRRTAHANTKYCVTCRDRFLRAPRSRVTAAQAAQLAPLLGTMPRWQIAQAVGISHAQLNRYLTEQGLRSNARDYPPAVVDAVASAYEAAPPGQGMATVRTLFPDVRPRSITERRAHHRPLTQPRQIRWTGEEQLELVRMAGLVSHTAQARYFGRPNAFEGSIKSFWTKSMDGAPRDVHGLGHHTVWHLATPGVPAVLVAQQEQPGPRVVVLWLDLVTHLRPGVDPEVRRLVEVLARFQSWIFAHISDSEPIRQMIQGRENYGRDDPGAGEWIRDNDRGLAHADRAV